MFVTVFKEEKVFLRSTKKRLENSTWGICNIWPTFS